MANINILHHPSPRVSCPTQEVVTASLLHILYKMRIKGIPLLISRIIILKILVKLKCNRQTMLLRVIHYWSIFLNKSMECSSLLHNKFNKRSRTLERHSLVVNLNQKIISKEDHNKLTNKLVANKDNKKAINSNSKRLRSNSHTQANSTNSRCTCPRTCTPVPRPHRHKPLFQ